MGDATIDHFFFIHDANVACDIDKENCKLILNFADKLAVDKYEKYTAGNSMNHAIGSSLLGLNTAYYGVVGKDGGGDEIALALTKAGVSTKYLARDAKGPTNNHAVISFQGERTILVHHASRAYKFPSGVKTKWVYLSSVGPKITVPTLHKQVIAYLKQNPSVKMALNPGTYQMQLELEGLRLLFARTEVLFMNKEEYERVLGMTGKNVKQLLMAMYDIGPTVCVLTDGPKGSYVYDGEKFFYLEIFDTPVIERTGCGDAFGAGFTTAFVYGLGVEEAMRWGTMNSAYTIGKVGPQNGLLKKAQMLALLKKHKTFRPREI